MTHSDECTDQNTYKDSHVTTRATILVTEFLPLLAILLIPASVHAGVFSSLVGLWTDEVVEERTVETFDYSARYTPLLSATLNPDPQKAVGGGDVTVENGALVSTGPVGADEIAASNSGGGEISVYVVREGDALSQIAEMYGVTTNTILWANDITKASGIQPGQTLVILPIVGVRHEVAKGETLGSILKKYDADLEEVLEYNNLASADQLSVGDELMIPGGEINIPRRVAHAAPTKSTGATGGGGFSHPVPGSVRTQGIHGYNGVDLAGSYGTSIRAAAAGEVIISKPSGWNGGYGQYIVIRHNNGTQTLYSHLSSNSVGVGAYVSQGQVIGGMGSTGKSTGNHLHFEVRGGRNPF
ncbi:MAG: LysM repeat protein [Acidimicrobiales bacterium]|jgi:LysM repeat protein